VAAHVPLALRGSLKGVENQPAERRRRRRRQHVATREGWNRQPAVCEIWQTRSKYPPSCSDLQDSCLTHPSQEKDGEGLSWDKANVCRQGEMATP